MSQHRNIVIIGGGIAGGSIAYHLSEETSRPIIVLEKSAVASETTAKSGAHVGYWGNESLTHLEMKRYSTELYNEFLSESSHEWEYHHAGRLTFSTTGDGEEQLASRVESESARTNTDSPAEALTKFFPKDKLRQALFLPGIDRANITGALYRANFGFIRRPEKIAEEFISRASSNGVIIREHAAVSELITDDGEVVGVTVDGDDIPAGDVVCAAGPWNRSLLDDFKLNLPLGHSVMNVMRLDERLSNGHSIPEIRHHENVVTFRDNGDSSTLVIKAGGVTPGPYEGGVDREILDGSVPNEIRESMLAAVRSLAPHLSGASVEDEWRCIMSQVPDGDNILGPTSVPGLSIAYTSADGIMLAPAIGKIVSDRLLKGDENLPGYYEGAAPERYEKSPDTHPDTL